MPLVGLEPVAAALPGGLGAPLQLHTFLALASSGQPEQCMLLDFLPERPTDPATALALATGGSVRGQLRVRRLRSWIRGGSIRTRLVTRLERPLSDAEASDSLDGFNSRWDSQLRLSSNDCRHYTAALLSHLTARPYGINDLW